MQPKQLDTGLSQGLLAAKPALSQTSHITCGAMKFGLRFALLAQTKCQNLSPSSRLSRVTRLSSSLSSDRPSYDYTSEDCTVVFDADGAYCMEEAALMSRVNVENCIRDSANPARTRRLRRCLRSAPSTRLTGRRPRRRRNATCPRSTRSSWTASSRRSPSRSRRPSRSWIRRAPSRSTSAARSDESGARLSRVDTKTKHL